MMYLRNKFLPILAAVLCTAAFGCNNVIELPAYDGDATVVLRRALEEAAEYDGRPVTIRLAQGDYHVSRDKASCHVYFVSNTASAEEKPDPTKHIGLWLRGLRNVTIDGNGARIVTHGEMSPIVIVVRNNVFEINDSHGMSPDSLVEARNTSGLVLSDNRIKN